jgi:creatinine amidohydrolase
MEENVEYEFLLPYQFEDRLKQCPLVFIPVGSLEWHGEHLAVGNDAIKMHGICCEAARQGGGIVFPPIYHGIPYMVNFGRDYQFNGSLSFPEDLLKNLLITTLEKLEHTGFKAAILITGHTPDEQSALVRQIAGEYQGRMRVHGTDDMSWAQELNYTSDHAAKWETSILWYLRPDLVDIYRLPKDIHQELEGIYGDDPRIYADKELGKTAVYAIASDLVKLGQRLLGEEGG